MFAAAMDIAIDDHDDSADVRGESPNCCHLVCCCGHPLDHVRVTTSTDGIKTLTLRKGEGESVSRKIMNQVEETQRIERD
jgi:hypothetical protein